MADIPIVSTILQKLTEMAMDKTSEAWEMVRGVEKEVKRLQSNFEAIQHELEDAEEKEYLDRTLKLWLDWFREVVYDMEDVLDDWKTAVQNSQKEEAETDTFGCFSQWKVCRPFVSCFSSGSQVVRRYDIASRIKEINEELQQIVNDKASLKLIRKEIKPPKRPQSTSFADLSELIGRETVKDEIIRILQCGNSEEGKNRNIQTISIVGIGGMGKTSLARLIYHDGRVEAHFDKIIWVSVADPFDEIQVARAILQSLDPASTASLQNQVSLQYVLDKIVLKMKKMKFFLVLDDVWTDRPQDWEQLNATLNCGIHGSWILVTSRKESVATAMVSSHIFPLRELNDKLSWSIMAQNAFRGRDIDSRKNFEDIGMKLAAKCGGLPLAAKALGCLLQDKTEREEWANVLNSDIWKSEFEKEVFTPLLLSYFDLPPELRQRLSYCAIFPKSYQIGKDELVQHWVVHGYLNADSIQQKQLQGEDDVKYLTTRSFFQVFGKDDSGNIISFKMHDLVHDFIQFLAKDKILIEMVGKDSTLDLSSKRARHLRLITRKSISFPMSICSTEKLRSLVIVSSEFEVLTIENLQNLFSQYKRLRLLEFKLFNLDAKGMLCGIENLIS